MQKLFRLIEFYRKENIVFLKNRCIFAFVKQSKYITMATAVKRTPSEVKQLKKQLVDVLLKKTGITLDDLYTTARKRFVNNNLGLLTATERKKFDTILLAI